MEKIKDLTKCILPEGAMLVEIIEPKRLIIRPDGETDKDSYGRVISITPTVTDIKVGDIIIKYGGSLYGYAIKSVLAGVKDRTVAVMFRGQVSVAVTPDNFIDPDKIVGSVSV